MDSRLSYGILSVESCFQTCLVLDCSNELILLGLAHTVGCLFQCYSVQYSIHYPELTFMQLAVFTELFPAFKDVNPDTLELLLSAADEHDYPANRAVLMEDSWGNAIYFLVSGWAKVRRLAGEDTLTLAIIGRGDFFGEMAILDESPRSTDVSALSPVKLISIPAQTFVQALHKDPKLSFWMLQMMVRRLRQNNLRFQLRNQPPAVKLVNLLISLAETYGNDLGSSLQLLNIPILDLANVADIKPDEAGKIMDVLSGKGWIKAEESSQSLHLVNRKQLYQLAQRS